MEEILVEKLERVINEYRKEDERSCESCIKRNGAHSILAGECKGLDEYALSLEQDIDKY